VTLFGTRVLPSTVYGCPINCRRGTKNRFTFIDCQRVAFYYDTLFYDILRELAVEIVEPTKGPFSTIVTSERYIKNVGCHLVWFGVITTGGTEIPLLSMDRVRRRRMYLSVFVGGVRKVEDCVNDRIERVRRSMRRTDRDFGGWKSILREIKRRRRRNGEKERIMARVRKKQKKRTDDVPEIRSGGGVLFVV